VPAMTSTKASGAIRRSAGLESKIRTGPLLPGLTVRSLCLIAPLAALAVSDGSLRSLRCSLGAAVFVGSDETTVS
jgi:hypothetical protein